MRPCSRWGLCSSIPERLSWRVRVSFLPLSGLCRVGLSAGEYGYDSATHIFSESVDYFVSADDSFERVVFEKCFGCFSPVVVGSFSSDARNEFINHVSRIIP